VRYLHVNRHIYHHHAAWKPCIVQPTVVFPNPTYLLAQVALPPNCLDAVVVILGEPLSMAGDTGKAAASCKAPKVWM